MIKNIIKRIASSVLAAAICITSLADGFSALTIINIGDTIYIEMMQGSDIYEKESFGAGFVDGNGGLYDCVR